MPMLPNGIDPNKQPLQFGASTTGKAAKPESMAIPVITAEMTRNSGKIGPNHDLNPSWSPVESGEILKGTEAHQGGDDKFWAKK